MQKSPQQLETQETLLHSFSYCTNKTMLIFVHNAKYLNEVTKIYNNYYELSIMLEL